MKKYNQKMIIDDKQFSRIKLTTKKTLTIPPLTTCLITYAALCKEDNIVYFKNSPPNLIVFDEYHTLTNNAFKKDGEYRNAIMKLPIRLRIGLTATPFVNNEMESVIAYGLLNDLNLIEKFLSGDFEKRKSLLKMIKEKKFLFYKTNSYNLTPLSEWIISIPMGKDHYNQYLSIKKEYESETMSSLHKIGKLTVSPSLLDKNQKMETGKIKALKSIVSHLPDTDKLVIFDNYRDTLQYIMRLNFIRPLKPVLLIGGSKRTNEINLEKFTNTPDVKVLLTTRQAGGEGINLQAANHLVLLNCWWTVKDIIQILGRIKRKGQKKPIYSYILGYNLFDCLETGKTPYSNTEAYILPEDADYYKAIWHKKEMCEDWGIEVETKFPPLKAFIDFSTFEKDFDNFLDQVFLGNPADIISEELKNGLDPLTEEYYEDETLLEKLIKICMKQYREKNQSHNGIDRTGEKDGDSLVDIRPRATLIKHDGLQDTSSLGERRRVIVIKKKK